MPICKSCTIEFPNRVVVDGVVRILYRRKFCLKCSAFGEHNTSATNSVRYHCACGETDRDKFSPTKTRICRQCHSKYTTERGQVQKQRARDHLGGKCQACGYAKHQVALDIHHVDPKRKDPNFGTMRGWLWRRILKELKHCMLLCKNCHTAHHSGFDIFEV